MTEDAGFSDQGRQNSELAQDRCNSAINCRLARHSATPTVIGERQFTRWAFREACKTNGPVTFSRRCQCWRISEMPRMATFAGPYGLMQVRLSQPLL